MKYLWISLLTVRVMFPMNTITYRHVKECNFRSAGHEAYECVLEDGKHLIAPVIFTIIEEE